MLRSEFLSTAAGLAGIALVLLLSFLAKRKLRNLLSRRASAHAQRKGPALS